MSQYPAGEVDFLDSRSLWAWVNHLGWQGSPVAKGFGYSRFTAFKTVVLFESRMLGVEVNHTYVGFHSNDVLDSL